MVGLNSIRRSFSQRRGSRWERENDNDPVSGLPGPPTDDGHANGRSSPLAKPPQEPQPQPPLQARQSTREKLPQITTTNVNVSGHNDHLRTAPVSASASPLSAFRSAPATGSSWLKALKKDSNAVLSASTSGIVTTVRGFEGALDVIAHGGPNGRGLDDRKMVLESVISFLAGLHNTSQLIPYLNDRLITLLWNDLPHPPATYLASPHMHITDSQPTSDHGHGHGGMCPFAGKREGGSYPFHTPTGAYNNPLLPTLGVAGGPYARTVQGIHPGAVLEKHLPDPGLVFDTLLARPHPDTTPTQSSTPTSVSTTHPGGLNSFFFAFANLVIHSLFNSQPDHMGVNASSSYLDLSPLYGSSPAELASVRRGDGSGRLWEDCWADARIGYMPPSSVALIVVFCRNHNYVASTLLAINEAGWYRPSSHLEDEEHQTAREKQDQHIFERARLINCHHFMQVIVTDYLGGILGLTREGNSFTLSPLNVMQESAVAPGGEKVPRGLGNVCSAEFNLLYRWHAVLGPTEVKYTESLFAQLIPSASPTDITVPQFVSALSKLKDSTHHTSMSPRSRPLPIPPSPETTRLPSGAFPTATIANILMNATNEAAHPFGARCIPRVMRVVEMMGIEQARKWGVGGLNELRRVLGLKAYETFLQWNPDPVIAGAAEALYGNVDNLELYPGLLAEETKKPIPGAGLCPGFTVSRAILSDAVALVRGDRLLSVERTPTNMTAWGYQDTQRDIENGAFGCMMFKLLLRTLPGTYSPSSVYALFPFINPESMRTGLEKHKKHVVQNYDWSTPAAVKRAEADDPPSPTAASPVEIEVLVSPLVLQNGTGNGHVESNGSINQSRPRFGTRMRTFSLKRHIRSKSYPNPALSAALAAADNEQTDPPAQDLNETRPSRSLKEKPLPPMPRDHVIHVSAGDPHLTNLTFGPATRSVAALHSLLGEQATSGWVDTDAMRAALQDSLPPYEAQRDFVKTTLTAMIDELSTTFTTVEERTTRTLHRVNLGKVLGRLPQRMVQERLFPLPSNFTASDFRTLYECTHILPYATDQSGTVKMREKVMALGQTLSHQIRSELGKAASLASHLKFSEGYAKSSRETFLAKFHQQRTGASMEDLAAELFGFVIAVIPVWGVAMITVINYYLNPGRSARLEEIVRLCSDDSRERSEVEAALEVYCQAALRNEPPLSNIAKTITLSHKGKQSESIEWPSGMSPGDTVVIDLLTKSAITTESSVIHGHSVLSDLLPPSLIATLPEVLLAVFSRPNIQLCTHGGLNRFMMPSNPLLIGDDGRFEWMYQDSEGSISRWPQTFSVQHD